MNFGIGRRILHGIGQQIVERIFHQFAIAGQRAFDGGIEDHRDLLALGEGSRALHAGVDQIGRGERLLLQLHLAVGQAFDVEEGLRSCAPAASIPS